MPKTEKQLTRARRNHLIIENARWPREPIRVQESEWPLKHRPPGLVALWRSRDYLIQVFEAPGGIVRLSVNRAWVRQDGHFSDGLSWDELQKIKAWLGYADRDAVEIYPAEEHVVNVANMRHLWVLPAPLGIGWRNPTPEEAREAIQKSLAEKVL